MSNTRSTIHSKAAAPSSAAPIAPDAIINILAPPVGDAVAEAAVPLDELDVEEPPEAAPPVAVDSLAFNCASADGRSDADTPVPFLQLLGTTSAIDVKVMSAHCIR
jgi:hypothetical protein